LLFIIEFFKAYELAAKIPGDVYYMVIVTQD